MSPRAGLDRATVVEAAAALADQKGLENLTLGHVAERLGIRTPSLYNHIAGLPGLRGEMAVVGVRELTRRVSQAAIGKTGDEAIEALADAYRAFVRERPGLYAATFPASRFRKPAHPDLQCAEEEALVPMLTVLASFKLTDEDALHALRCLTASMHGFATMEVAGGFGLALSVDESFRRLVRTYIDGLRQFSQVS